MSLVIKRGGCRTAFIHVPKTGGGSVVRYVNGTKGVVYSKNSLTHTLYRDLKGRVDDSFSVVRNPWDRIISWYFFIYQISQRKLKDKSYATVEEQKTVEKELILCELGIEFFIKENWYDTKQFFNAHTNQIEWVHGVNNIFRFEDYKELINYTQKLLNTGRKFPHEHKTRHKNYRYYYTPELINFVGDVFERDIKAFNYDF